MTTWQDFAARVPEFAALVRGRFEADKHHVLATLRTDGSPRVSGTEVQFYGPDLTFGSMWGAVKARDLQRDPRCALHAHPSDESMQGGDAKLGGRAVEVADAEELSRFRGEVEVPPGEFHLFRLELTEAVHTRVEGDKLLIRRWTPQEGIAEYHR